MSPVRSLRLRWVSTLPSTCTWPPLISNLAPPSQCARPVAFSSASEEGVELVFDELRRVGAGGVFGLGEKGRGLLLRSV
jgi:hypothetical protein